VVVDFRKSITEGPAENAGLMSDFLALERIALPVGNYDLIITLHDLNDTVKESATEIYSQKIEINNLSEGVFVSDIELVSAYSKTMEQNAFSKSGYDILPYVSNYYPTQIQALMFYAEVYNSDKYFGTDSAYIVVAAVHDLTGAQAGEHKRIKREKGKPVCPIMQAIDISKLTSGEYWLVVEVRDKHNTPIISKRTKFVRNYSLAESEIRIDAEILLAQSFAGKFTDRDTLYAIIMSMTPVSGNREGASIDNQLMAANVQQLQSFFFTFWEKRNAADPEGEWLKYKKFLAEADAEFGNKIREGWQTDRGRIYLQYGPPNSRIERHNNPDYWPFEIWHYYGAAGGHNLKFLFSNPSLSGDFELIHADAPGEISNASWKEMVRSGFRDDTITTNRNALNQRDTKSGDELEELWYNPH